MACYGKYNQSCCVDRGRVDFVVHLVSFLCVRYVAETDFFAREKFWRAISNEWREKRRLGKCYVRSGE
jgi:hypothetical protein